MGTNIYAMIEHGDGSSEPIHLGKFSCGWRFLVDNASSGVACWDDLDRLLDDRAHGREVYLEDEYGEEVSIADFKKRVLEASTGRHHVGVENMEIVIRSGPIDIWLNSAGFC